MIETLAADASDHSFAVGMWQPEDTGDGETDRRTNFWKHAVDRLVVVPVHGPRVVEAKTEWMFGIGRDDIRD